MIVYTIDIQQLFMKRRVRRTETESCAILPRCDGPFGSKCVLGACPREWAFIVNFPYLHASHVLIQFVQLSPHSDIKSISRYFILSTGLPNSWSTCIYVPWTWLIPTPAYHLTLTSHQCMCVRYIGLIITLLIKVYSVNFVCLNPYSQLVNFFSVPIKLPKT